MSFALTLETGGYLRDYKKPYVIKITKITNCFVRGQRCDPAGRPLSSYIMNLKKKDHKFRVFEEAKGAWDHLDAWKIATRQQAWQNAIDEERRQRELYALALKQHQADFFEPIE